eukprot:1153750-Pelagomonas_calceolata.AAC.8
MEDEAVHEGVCAKSRNGGRGCASGRVPGADGQVCIVMGSCWMRLQYYSRPVLEGRAHAVVLQAGRLLLLLSSHACACSRYKPPDELMCKNCVCADTCIYHAAVWPNACAMCD